MVASSRQRRLSVVLLLTLPFTGTAFSTTTTTTSSRSSSTTTRSPGLRRSLPASTPCLRSSSAVRIPPRQQQQQQHQHQAVRISSNEDRAPKPNHRKGAWPSRVWSRIVRRTRKTPTAPLRMQTMDQETEDLLETLTSHYYDEDYTSAKAATATTSRSTTTTSRSRQEEFILRNLEDFAPPLQEGPPAIDSEFFDVSIIESAADTKKTSKEESSKATKATTTTTTTTTKPKQPSAVKALFVARWMGLLFENILTSLIERLAVEAPEGLRLHATPKRNAMAALLRGQFRTDATIDVGRLVFPNIRLSSGQLEVKRLTLQLLGFLGTNNNNNNNNNNGNDNNNNNSNSNRGGGKQKQKQPQQPTSITTTPTRFPKQFDLHARDWTFTRHDLLFSTCIRNGLQRLLVRIFRDRGVQSSSIKVTSLDILPSGKISITGQALTHFDAPISFEVRSGISFSSRGHVLTFPGLEVSLSGDLGLFVPVVPTIDLDVGHNARFTKIDIDGAQKLLKLCASVTITPQSTIRLSEYQQSKEAFSARFSTDVGQWLTKVGNFSK